jgi:hypothetical protein
MKEEVIGISTGKEIEREWEKLKRDGCRGESRPKQRWRDSKYVGSTYDHALI